MPTPHELFEEKLRRHEEEKQQISHDMRELERLTLKYGLLVIAYPSPESRPVEEIPRSLLNQAAREADAIIRATGHPVQIHDLFRIITLERNMPIASTNTLSTALISSRKLKYIKDIGWWFPNVPWPPSKEDIARLQSEPAFKPPPMRVRHKGGKGGQKRTPEKQLLFDTVKTLLKGRSEPMKFSELFDRVEKMGVPIGGIEPRKNFASFIAKFPCFESVGRGAGWRYLPERDFDEQRSEPQP